MINAESFSGQIDLAYHQISSLPAGEIKYHLYILVTSIKEKNNAKTQLFLTELLSLIDSLHQLHQLPNYSYPEFNYLFSKIREHYLRLGTIAETNNLSAQTKIGLLHTAGATFALVGGIMGGIIGGISGFARGLWHSKPATGFGVGFVAGFLMGGTLGFRAPNKLFKNELKRQVKFGLDGIECSFAEMPKEIPSSSFFNSKVVPLSVYQQKAMNEINGLFETGFEFEEFLASKIDYEINTVVATFINEPMLAGYLGHHSYIKMCIKSNQYGLEFTPEPTNLSSIPAQSERRTVLGIKLIEMLACHRKLQETHACDVKYILTKLKPGDTDCLSYVNKILLCTNQEATAVNRFSGMNPVGTFVGGLYAKLSPFATDFFRQGKVFDDEMDSVDLYAPLS